MLEKKTVTDKIEIVNADTIPMIQVRQATWVEENGVVLGGKGYHRYVVTPASELQGESSQVQAMAMALFTQDVKDAYAAKLAEQEEQTANTGE